MIVYMDHCQPQTSIEWVPKKTKDIDGALNGAKSAYTLKVGCSVKSDSFNT